jgi:hypothetical protein
MSRICDIHISTLLTWVHLECEATREAEFCSNARIPLQDPGSLHGLFSNQGEASNDRSHREADCDNAAQMLGKGRSKLPGKHSR